MPTQQLCIHLCLRRKYRYKIQKETSPTSPLWFPRPECHWILLATILPYRSLLGTSHRTVGVPKYTYLPVLQHQQSKHISRNCLTAVPFQIYTSIHGGLQFRCRCWIWNCLSGHCLFWNFVALASLFTAELSAILSTIRTIFTLPIGTFTIFWPTGSPVRNRAF